MNLVQLLHDQAQMRPLAVALRDFSGRHSRSISYAQLDQAAARAAALLRKSGLQSGDRVLVFLPISVDLYVAMAALFRLGMAAIFIDPGMGRAHIERCCTLAAPQAFLGPPRAHLLRLVCAALRRIPIKFVTGMAPRGFPPGARRWRHLDAMRPLATIVNCPPETPALITFTSGSTGQPKMVVRSHRFLLQQHDVITDALPLPQDSVILTNLPIFVLSNLAGGKTTLIPDVDLRRPADVNPKRIVDLARQERVTCIEASPVFVEKVVNYCAGHAIRLPDISRIYMGGAPVFLDQIEQTKRTFLRTRIIAVYGSTEAEPIARLDGGAVASEDVQRTVSGHGLLVGRPVPAAQVRILPDRWGQPIGPLTPDEFDRQVLAAGDPGEIVVSGPHVLSGYWQGIGDPEGSPETKIHVGDTVWHRTGDAGYFDDDGRLWLLGRCVVRIHDRHGEIYPFAVECAVRRFANVRRSAFVLHPQTDAGAQTNSRRVLAMECVQRNDDNLAGEIRRTLAWAHIDDICCVDRLPVDPRHNSKIDYPALYRLLDKRRG